MECIDAGPGAVREIYIFFQNFITSLLWTIGFIKKRKLAEKFIPLNMLGIEDNF